MRMSMYTPLLPMRAMLTTIITLTFQAIQKSSWPKRALYLYSTSQP